MSKELYNDSWNKIVKIVDYCLICNKKKSVYGFDNSNKGYDFNCICKECFIKVMNKEKKICEYEDYIIYIYKSKCVLCNKGKDVICFENTNKLYKSIKVCECILKY